MIIDVNISEVILSEGRASDVHARVWVDSQMEEPSEVVDWNVDLKRQPLDEIPDELYDRVCKFAEEDLFAIID